VSLQTTHLYEFGPFRMDTDQRLLVRNDEVVPVTPKVFDTLLALVERGGRVVEKAELMNLLWPETFVEESNLTFNISILGKRSIHRNHSTAWLSLCGRYPRSSD
jgi:DNA-binding winged helix-turn-helix (wHTH) protein